MAPLAKQVVKRHSYKEYSAWLEGRWELIEGVEYDMTPAPSRLHQEISMIISAGFYSALKGTECKVYAAPFDVRLATTPEAEDNEVFTVVQPDIVIVCDLNKLDDKGCNGAPDLIVEILSPATALKDMKIKRDIYEKFKVKEYWLVHPYEKLIMVYTLGENEQYPKADVFAEADIIVSTILPEIKLNLAGLFGPPLPKASPG